VCKQKSKKKSESSVCQAASCCSKSSKTSLSARRRARYFRNPFLVFLADFRKRWTCRLSAYESAAMAGKIWSCLTEEERDPYVKIARNYQYVYRSKNTVVNWVLHTIREFVEKDPLDRDCLLRLVAQIGAWNDGVMAGIVSPVGKRK
ncbi:hypothetical protein KR222_002240, partial [Zaprionus bogoriensis]